MADNFYVVAIDFPGHGLSSHLPAGCPYNDVVFVIELQRVILSLGWNTKPITILGHSMGAAIGMYYTCLFPKNVQRLIALDIIKPLTFPSDKLAEKTKEGIESFLQLEAKSLPAHTDGPVDTESPSSTVPLYEHSKAVEKLIAAHSVFGRITPEGAATLLKRGCKQSPKDPKKVFFTRDNRLKAMLFQRMDNDSLAHYFFNLKCQLLIIKAEKGVKLDPDDISKKFIELYKKQCSRFEYVQIPGGHHVHLCHPENVCQPIIDFINKCNQQQQNGEINGEHNVIEAK